MVRHHVRHWHWVVVKLHAPRSTLQPTALRSHLRAAPCTPGATGLAGSRPSLWEIAEMSGLVLAIVATAVAAASSVEASSSGFVQTRFVIGGGPDPPCTQTSYANVRAVGCTFLHADSNAVTSAAGAQQMATLCAANNLTCVLPLAGLKAVAPGANVWGYFLHDEPGAKDFAGIAKQVAEVRALRPTALSFVNLGGFADLGCGLTANNLTCAAKYVVAT